MEQSVFKQSKNLAFLFAVLVAFSMTSAFGYAQRSKPHSASNNNAIYALPHYWPNKVIVMFKDEKAIATEFMLVTSWVPGESMNGMMRYQLIAYPVWQVDQRKLNDNDEYSEAIEKYVDKVNSCTIYLVLSDIYGFNLRREEISFEYGANDKGRIVDLYANSSIKMSIDEYKILLKSSDGYSIEWVDLNRLKP